MFLTPRTPRWLIVALTLGALAIAVIGFTYWIGELRQDASNGQVLQQAVIERIEATNEAKARSEVIQVQVEQIQSDTQVFIKEAARHVPARPAQASARGADPVSGPGLRAVPEPQVGAGQAAPAEVHLAHGGDRLLAGAVCLLDAIRAGEDAHRAAGRCDEAGDAPSAVDVSQLIAADIDAVGRYNELMTRHNALVDYVEDLKRKSEE